MALLSGTRLGPYEIVAPLGAGGMGEVYRARDTSLSRDVAIKVLPADVVADPERLARFKREAQLLAALNHPNIAAIHGLDQADGKPFLVLELVEGEDLAERLKRGPIPLDEALPIAKQVAEALEEAHEHGIVHRDLKPANIKLTPDGKVKVLDFGLAKAYSDGAEGTSTPDVSHSPTLTRGTEAGVILGTAAYMSPEQARGRPVDRRTDVWAFGCVLFEALAGRRPFDGETITDILAAIVRQEPPWERLPPATPEAIRRLLRRCLEKDPRQRLHSIADARIEIGEASSAVDVLPRKRDFAGWRGGAVLGLACLGGGLLLGMRIAARHSGATAPTPAPVTRAVIEPPVEAALALGTRLPAIGYESTLVAVSPDGHRLAYVGETPGGGTQLYLRDLDRLEVKPIAGTEGAIHPFFSPDGRWLGFLTADKVKKVALDGGAPVTLCNARTAVRASWTRDDLIYFGEQEGALLSRVSASGGASREVAHLRDKKLNQVLPDGRSALVTDNSRGISSDYATVKALALDTLAEKPLIESGYDARYVSGHLLFTRGGNLMAVPFDRERLEVQGEPFVVVTGVSTGSFFGHSQVAASENGLLVYVPGGDGCLGRLAWVDRKGGVELLPTPERFYGVVELAPGGRRLAVHVADVTDYVWIYDLRRNEGRRLTADGSAGWPIFSPDGQSLAVVRSGGAQPGLYRYPAGDRGGSVERLAEAKPLQPRLTAYSWSGDGGSLAVNSWNEERMGVLAAGGGSQVAWLPTKGNAWGGSFSPDGRFLAYSSDETGQNEIWVRSLPDGSVRQVSPDGGLEPLWSKDALYYRKGRQWFASRITRLAPDLAWEPPRLVFETDFLDTPGRSYAVSPDGQRLLVVKRAREPVRSKIAFVQNWLTELPR